MTIITKMLSEMIFMAKMLLEIIFTIIYKLNS